MRKINVEATKLNNEDVIATSSESCKGKYHIVINEPNYSGGSSEQCYIYKENELGVLVWQYGASPVTELDNAFDSDQNWGDVGYVDLGNPNQGDVYYWDGSTWKKCNENHTFE